MEQKLKNIVARVQASALPNEVKADLYVAIQEGLRQVAMPILLKHMPEGELTDLAAHPEKVSVDAYIDFLSKTVKDGQVLIEIEAALIDVLAKVEERLKKHT